ncbi:MAG: HAMP domain-containing protein [Syntrophobacteraceae bacterium]
MMQIKYKGSLQRTMIVYFLLISFASFLVAGEFIFDVHSKELRSELTQNFEKLSNGEIQPDAAFQPIQALRNKSVLMVALLLAVVLILLTMFIKTITEPLQHMIEASKLIAVGDLSQTVSVSAKNELAEMGNTINELTSNLQEMLLLSKDMCASVDQFTGEISDVVGSREIDQEKAEDLQHKIHLLNAKTKLMNDIILNCKFYEMGR